MYKAVTSWSKLENVNVTSVMNTCILYNLKWELKNKVPLGNLYMMFYIWKSDGSNSLYILSITPTEDISDYQKVLLIQCRWQYNNFKKVEEKYLQSLISSISLSTVRFCRKFHSMIYYINYSHVGFMLLSLKMQPHSTVDLRIYFGQDKRASYCD